MIPESKSAHESLWVSENIINPIFSWFGLTADKNIVRKIAHAVEFFILALIISLWWKKPIKSFYAGFTLAFLDESVQLITGRGALISDVWIDLIGVIIGTFIGFVITKMYTKSKNTTDIQMTIVEKRETNV